MKLLLAATFVAAFLAAGLGVIIHIAVNLKLPDSEQISWSRFGARRLGPFGLGRLYEKLYPDSLLALFYWLSIVAFIVLGAAFGVLREIGR